MELKGAGIQDKALNGLVYEICEIYMDDIFIQCSIAFAIRRSSV